MIVCSRNRERERMRAGMFMYAWVTRPVSSWCCMKQAYRCTHITHASHTFTYLGLIKYITTRIQNPILGDENCWNKHVINTAIIFENREHASGSGSAKGAQRKECQKFSNYIRIKEVFPRFSCFSFFLCISFRVISFYFHRFLHSFSFSFNC